MEKTRPVGKNFTYGPPQGQEDRVGSLDVRLESDDGGHAVAVSAWKPSEEELTLLNAGATIVVALWQHPICPLAVGVEPPTCPDDGEEMTWDGELQQYRHAHPEGDTDDEHSLGG